MVECKPIQMVRMVSCGLPYCEVAELSFNPVLIWKISRNPMVQVVKDVKRWNVSSQDQRTTPMGKSLVIDDSGVYTLSEVKEGIGVPKPSYK